MVVLSCYKHRAITLFTATMQYAVFAAISLISMSSFSQPAQVPVFLSSSVKPIMMLNMSNDHQLYFKLYDDYSDIIDMTSGSALPGSDGLADTTYNNDYDYYGYFDSEKCYLYSTTNSRFEPDSFTTNRYCNHSATVSNQWSGNFLNWSTMTRIDAVRKILYGGLRRVDTAGETVLERTFLPNDAHSFAKYYAGSDVGKLTPFSSGITTSDPLVRTDGLTICNTTQPAAITGDGRFSQNATGPNNPPLMRVVKGNYSLWASGERFQCLWNEDTRLTGGRGKNTRSDDTGSSDIKAYGDSPKRSTAAIGDAEYVVRVSVCDSGFTKTPSSGEITNNEGCESFGGASSSSKPSGLLQEFRDQIDFGLLTGSYGKNKSGGVLRKAVSDINSEIKADDGTFISPTGTQTSIIETLNLFRLYGYNFGNGLYNNDRCKFGFDSFANGACTNWGNPQAEIYLESLRYLAGEASARFDTDDTRFLGGLNRETSWSDPVDVSDSGNYCAPLNILQFNASSTSYDGDELTNPGFSSDPDTLTDAIADAEGISGGTYFVGENGGGDNNQLCTAKTISKLSDVRGVCPDAPRLEGSYKMAGLAYLARRDGLREIRGEDSVVRTYGVSLAPAVPQATVSVPGNDDRKITILPACRNTSLKMPGSKVQNRVGNCAIVDFKVVEQSSVDDPDNVGSTINTGKLYVNWEDSEQGGDYDQDMWGVISYAISSSGVSITTNVFGKSTGNKMGFGYVISGTADDGFHAHSGINGYSNSLFLADFPDCSDSDGCKSGDGDSTKVFAFGSATADSLEPPLYYAAKWGGYNDVDGIQPDRATIASAAADTYFFATEPRALEASLRTAFRDIAKTVGSAATVAANSKRLDGDTFVYQAVFDSKDWSGQLLAFPVEADGSIDTSKTPAWSTTETLTSSTTRQIYTSDGGAVPNLETLNRVAVNANIPAAIKTALTLTSESEDDAVVLNRYNWLLGDQSKEDTAGGLRERTKILGDIVNSDPSFAGNNSQGFNALPSGDYGGDSYLTYVKKVKQGDDGDPETADTARASAIFVGANDGMLHGFSAADGSEIFAYIPRGVYSKLAELSFPDYDHQYYVDGPVYVSDAYIDPDGNGQGGKEWRTILVGTLGAGGKGIYALDITDTLGSPSSPRLAPRVIFDYSAEDNVTPAGLKNDIGYILSAPIIAPTDNGEWSVIFGNGYESTNNTAKLVVINLDKPSEFVTVDTEAAGANGLSGMALLTDGTGIVNYAYAGDLKGNMWKFDLKGNNSSGWKVGYEDGNGNNAKPVPLVTVGSPDSTADTTPEIQPITSTPTLGLNKLKLDGDGDPSIMVYFGTGKYYELSDGAVQDLQSIYAIADTGKRLTLDLENRVSILHEKRIATETGGVRTITGDKTPVDTEVPEVDWATKDGWFLDLASPVAGAEGERSLQKLLLLFDRLVAITYIPPEFDCDFIGEGWLMELTAVGDKNIGFDLLDNPNIFLEVPVIGGYTFMLTRDGGSLIFSEGSSVGDGAGGSPRIRDVDLNVPANQLGRMSWRQIK